MRQFLKYAFLFSLGGMTYNLIEIGYRGWTHWTMFFLGGMCFVSLGLLNEVIPWEMPLWQQVFAGACIITILEFVTGCIVNVWFEWNVWNYADMPGNILGQICPQFFVLWLLVALSAIVTDDWIRHWMFDEEQPHYRIL